MDKTNHLSFFNYLIGGLFAFFFVFVVYSILFLGHVEKAAALPNTVSSSPWIANGTVYEVERASDGTIYLGGDFTYVGPYTGVGLAINKTTGSATSTYPVIKGDSSMVRIAIPDGSGGWYVGGSFSSVGGTTKSNIARISADGSLDETFTTTVTGGDVYSLLLDSANNRLYIGGFFSQVNGINRASFAVVNATTGSLVDWKADTDNTVKTMALDGGILYLGGDFSTIAGDTRNKLAALDTTTIGATTTPTTTAWNPNVDNFGAVNDLKISGDSVYIGGNFTTVGGTARNNVAELDKATGNLNAWNPNVNNWVYALELDTSNVYVGGAFTTIGGDTRNYLGAISKTTGSSTAWNPDPSSEVYSIQLGDSLVYLGGAFKTVGGGTANSLAAVSKDTGLLNGDFIAHTSESVETLSLSGESLFVGGSFTSLGGVPRNRAAALNGSTGEATDWNPNVDSTVYAIAVDGTTVYLGGGFTTVGGTTRNKLASVNATTGALADWNPDVGGFSSVKDLAVDTSEVYVGGGFSTIGGDTRNYLAAVSKTTGSSTAWNPNLTGGFNGVSQVVLSGDNAYVVGDFTAVDGTTRNGIAAISKTTGSATSWDPNATMGFSGLTGIALGTSTAYVIGDFSAIGSQSRNKLAEISLSTGSSTSWNPALDGGFSAPTGLGISTSSVFVGGDFTTIGGDTRNYVAGISRTTGSSTSWYPTIGATPQKILFANNTVIMGGSFSDVNSTGKAYLAIFGPNTIGFTSTSISQSEATTSATFTIQIADSATSTEDITVDYAVSGGTATGGGVDYTLASGTATISAGQTSTTVTMTIVNDDTLEDDETAIVSLSNAVNANINAASSLTYTITNDDAAPAGVSITEAGGSTSVLEEGTTSDTYTIVLDSAPTDTVTITLSADSAQLSLSTTTLTFSGTNWNTAQTVTTTAVDDAIVEGAHTKAVTHTVASNDADYNGIAVNNVSIAITDNDTAGVTLTEAGGSTTVTEAGLSDTFTIVFTSQPTSSVTIALATASTDITLSTSSITFASSSWNDAVTVTVSAVNDESVEGNETATITFTVTSDDANYDGIAIANVSVSITDNDSESSSGGSSGGGGNIIAAPPQIPSITPAPLPSIQKSITVSPLQRTSFVLGKDVYALQTIGRMSDAEVTVRFPVQDLEIVLKKQEQKKVDVNKDGINDLQLTYKGLKERAADVDVESLTDSGEVLKPVTINKGAYKTQDKKIVLSFNVSGAYQMALSEDKDFKGASFIPFVEQTLFTLSEGTGEKTIYVRLRSEQGGMIDVSDSIVVGVSSVTQPQTSTLKNGSLVKSILSPKVYIILGNQLRWITSGNVFTSLGYIPSWIQSVSEESLSPFSFGSEISVPTHPLFSLVRASGSPKVYWIEQSSNGAVVKRHVPDEITANTIDYRLDRIPVVADLTQYSEGAPLPSVRPLAEQTNSYTFTSFLTIGSQGEEVRQLQTILSSLGYFTYPSVTGYYGPVTAEAVRRFQADRNIDPLGYVGPGTRAALNSL